MGLSEETGANFWQIFVEAMKEFHSLYPNTRRDSSRSASAVRQTVHEEKGKGYSRIDTHLLAFYNEWRSLIGYATHFLFCFSITLLVV